MRFLLFILASCCSIFNFAAGQPGNPPTVIQLTPPVDHSESPTWDNRNGILYFVNIHAGEIYRYNYETKELKSIKLDGEVAPVIPSKQNQNLLIAGLNRSVVAVEWDGQSNPSQTRILTTVSQQFPTSRFNDGKADKEGRLWIGTMGHEDSNGLNRNEGVLYKITCDNLENPQVMRAPVDISNGMAFNKANDRFYYIDTLTGQVQEYKFDLDEGEISDPRVVFDFWADPGFQGSPDGMTIDKDDNLWIALWGGGQVVKIDPRTSSPQQIVTIPAPHVTSAMWGGPRLEVLFVTTSRYSLNAEERKRYPKAGSVFAVLGLRTQGVPVYEVDLIDSIDDEECEE